MKRSSPPTALFGATLVLSALAACVPLQALAQTEPPRQQVEVKGQRAAHAAIAAEAKGRYALADGRTLDIGGAGSRLTVNIDGGETVALTALDRTRLASVDGRLGLQLHSAANGVVSGLVLTERRGAVLVRTASL